MSLALTSLVLSTRFKTKDTTMRARPVTKLTKRTIVWAEDADLNKKLPFDDSIAYAGHGMTRTRLHGIRDNVRTRSDWNKQQPDRPTDNNTTQHNTAGESRAEVAVDVHDGC